MQRWSFNFVINQKKCIIILKIQTDKCFNLVLRSRINNINEVKN